jgi:hypothetical protein
MPVGAGFNAKKTAQSEAAKYRGGGGNTLLLLLPDIYCYQVRVQG